MINWQKLTGLIKELTALTKSKKLSWDGNDMTAWICSFRGAKVVVWWYQDDKPSILVDEGKAVGYDLGISDLLTEIRAQRSPAVEAAPLESGSSMLDRLNESALNRALDRLIPANPKKRKK